MFKRLIYLLLFSVLFINTTYANSNEEKKMIEQVNIQKILTQKMFKDYAFMGLGNDYKDSAKRLPKLIKKYEEGMDKLKEILTKDEEKEILSNIQERWIQIKQMLSEHPNKDKIDKLQKKMDKLLLSYSSLMRYVIKRNPGELGKLIGLSSYLGVVLERMSGLYMMKSWGVKDPKFEFKMRESLNYFDNTLYDMENSEYTSSANRKRIEQLKKDFMFFRFMNKSQKHFIPTLIYDRTDAMQKVIHQITQDYIEHQ